MGSLKSPCTTSCRSSIETIALNCLVFEKNTFFCILATDRQTDKQMDTTDALSRSRCRERRLNKSATENTSNTFNVVQCTDSAQKEESWCALGLCAKTIYTADQAEICLLLSFFTRWHVPPLRTSAEACLTGWPNARPQGWDKCSAAPSDLPDGVCSV